MVCKNRGIYGFLGLSWVLITYNICPPRDSIFRLVGPLDVKTTWLRTQPFLSFVLAIFFVTDSGHGVAQLGLINP